MRMWVGLTAVMFGLGVFGAGMSFASEPGCYHTSAEAVAQVGVRGMEGYRLESVQRDVFSGITWATVRRCGHPEQPGIMILTPFAARLTNGAGAGIARRNEAAVGNVLVMLAGTRVRLLETSDNVQMEVSAIAQSSGAVGDQVRVRLVPVSSDGLSDGVTSWSANERFATGIVRSRAVVEVSTR